MANAIRKRIALAAAVAVSAGLLSAVPAQAAAANASGTEPFAVTAAEYAADSTGAAITVSTSNVSTDSTVSVIHNASNAANFIELAAGADLSGTYNEGVRVDVTGSTIASATAATSGTAATVNAARTSVTYAGADLFNSNYAGSAKIRVATAAAGSITVKVTGLASTNGVVTETLLQTFTATVNATASAGKVSVAKSTVFYAATTAAADAAAADVTTVIGDNDASANTAAGLAFAVKLKDANGVAVTETVTATITSGPGLVRGSDSTTISGNGAKVATVAASNNDSYFDIVSDGTNVGGTTVVTFTVGATVVATKSVKLFGKATTLEAKALATVENTGTTNAAVWVAAKDALGNLVPDVALTYTSGTAALVASASGNSADATEFANATGTTSVTAAGSATNGNATINIALTSDSTVKTSVVVVVSERAADKATVTFDKATYAPGEQVTMTLSLVDDNGLPVADSFAGAVTYSSNMSTSLPTGSQNITEVAGKATVKFFAPATAGAATITLTFGAAGNDYTANLGAKTASGTFTVATAGAADIAQLKTDLAALQKSTSDLIAALSAQVSYLRKQLNQLLKRR